RSPFFPGLWASGRAAGGLGAAMATRLAGRACWEVSPGEARRPRGAAAPAEAASPPVLSLSHFCRSPFLCFGDVRLGASRTLGLALANPNAEVAEVKISRFPAPDRGFSVPRRFFVLQPREKIVISINWTPIEEGRVREIITFLVNDVLKHQAILLGNAEEKKKKKRSLWGTINKKKVSASSSHSKRTAYTQNVNKTFNVSQKVERVKSPLQSCENFAMNEGCSPIDNHSLILENEICLSPISSNFKECNSETCLPLCIRRSTTYTSLPLSENEELLKVEGVNILKDFNEKGITETSFNSINSINDHIDECKLILTPNCSSTLNITQSQENFLSPNSFVTNSHTVNNELELVTVVSDTFMKDNSSPVHLESKIVHKIYRTFLSPDSFINDNYERNPELESESSHPILSPNQFVKDNMAYLCTSQEASKLSPLPNENSQASLSLQDLRKNGVLPCVPECQDPKSPKAIFEEPNTVEMKSNYHSFTQQNQPKCLAPQEISSYSQEKQIKRRPILSTTVTKRKPICAGGSQTDTDKPKAKRCLSSAVSKYERVTDNHKEKDTFHTYLPIIQPQLSKCKSHRNEIMPSSKTVSGTLKRKSERNTENTDVRVTVMEPTEVQEIKRIHFSPMESSTVKKTKQVITPISKRTHRDKLNLKKTDIPRHPMPFAAKNMFYDERWKEKQEKGFTWWLNFILTPDDFTVKTNISEVNAATLLLGMENQHKISVPRAPTKDEMSLRAYTARCRLNRLRRAACHLFTSEKMVKAIKKLEIEIEARRLIVRRDRHLWKDVGERQKVLNWLLSYNPLWLRIGLETIYGELLSLEGNSDVTGLAVFILNRLLWNPDIAAEYRHPSVPHLYRDGHEEALSKFTLKKLLLLVCFLDCAKISKLIDHDPCLFCKDAEFKTSKEILLAFSRDFLSGEGDLSRHLSLLGLPVNHVQTPFDEFDFAITNLAVDLQCGVRLVRIMELLTRNWNLSKKLRVPAISRLQKMHNVDIALQILQSRGIQLNDEHGNTIQSKDIVDRHREKTLALLWKIAFAFQVDISLNLDQLKEEIDFLKHTQNMKKARSVLSCHSDTVINEKKDKRNSCSFERYSENIKLLMDWVNAVCAFYNKKVENFTVSFSDGRVLCYLIHHYHPCYVPFDAICQRTTQTVECTQTGSVVLNSSSESDDSPLDMYHNSLDYVDNTSELYKELLENEKKNFQLVRSAVRDLGGIPAMIHHSDMSNTIPDEKVIITYLSFLCARLLDLRKETRAARIIQTTWRKYKLKTDLKHHQTRFRCFQAQQLYKKKKESILTIQKYYRAYLEGKVERTNYLQKRAAAILLQGAFRRMKAQKLHRQIRAACILQSYWRMRRDRLQFLNFRKIVIKLQAHVRKYQQFQKYKKMKKATLVIQSHFRAYVSAKNVLASYQKTRSAVIVLQSAYRGMRARNKFNCILTSIIKIQSYYRTYMAKKKFLHLKNATIKLQSIVKMKGTRKRYLHLRAAALFIQRWYRSVKLATRKRKEYMEMQESCIKLQAFVRGYLVRKQMRLQRKAAISLQSYFRMRKVRQNYLKICKATVVIQIYYHAYKAQVNQRKNFLQIKRAVTCLQAAYRGYRVRQLIKHQSVAALKIQTAFRGYSKRVKYQSVLQSTVKIQRWYRACRTIYEMKTCLLKTRTAVISLQSAYRGWKVRKQVRKEHEAAMKIQSTFRMAQAQKQFRVIKAAALVIQQHLRAWSVGKKQHMEYVELRHAALILQSTWKGKTARRHIQKQQKCAIIIQSYYRMHLQRRRWETMKNAAHLIQMYYRAYSIGRKQHHLYLKTKTSVVVLQSAYRGMRVRKKIKEWNKAAVTIQSKYRTYKNQQQYATCRASAIIIQRWFRGFKIANHQRKEYLSLKWAAIKIQATYRGIRIRRHIQCMHMAATVIQATFKMHQSKIRYQKIRAAAVMIQVRYRACYKGKTQREKFLTILKAVTTIQATFRGMRVRQAIRKMQVAATLLQSYYRRYRQQTYFNKLKKVTKTVQQRYRAVKEKNKQFQRYSKLRHSVICIQAAFRGMKTRRNLKISHLAATLIQRRFRTLLIRRRFLSLRKTAVWVQRKYRANACAKCHSEQFLRLRKAVIRIQSSYRGWMVRKMMGEMHRAAAVLQAAFRMHTARVQYQALKQASLVIQRQYRANRAMKLQRQCYLQQRHSVLTLQAAFRGMRTRRHLRSMHSSATLIQSKFRSSVMRKRFISLKNAAVFVQRKYRATICAKHHLHQFLQLQKAVVTIQSSYRRLIVKRKIEEMHRAAAVIQATFRMHRAYVTFQTWRHASVLIQQHYRGYRAVKLQRENFIRQRRSAVIIQAAYKGMKVRQFMRKRQRAAVIIQSSYRMYRQYNFYQKLRWAAKIIQEAYRANKKQKALLLSALTKAAACIQDMILRQQIQEQHQAALVVQKNFKASKIRKHYLHFRKTVIFIQRRYRALTAKRVRAVICIQSSYRGFRVRREIQHMHLAATRIQSFYRMHRANVDYQAKKAAAVVIQNYYRSYVRVKLERKKIITVQKPLPTIQAAGRGRKVRSELKNVSKEKLAAVPQSMDYYSRTETQCDAIQSSATGTQNCYISVGAWSQEAEVDLPRKTVVPIQKTLCKMVTRKLEMQKRAALQIQSFLQMAVCRQRFVQQKRAALTLQQYFRTWQARKQFLAYRKAAEILQNHHRAFLATKHQREVYLQFRRSIIIIQAVMKGFIQKRKFQKIKDSTIKIQISEQRAKIRLFHFTAAAFYHLSALKIQRAYKLHLVLKNANKQINSVIYIQALWRGYTWRKKNDSTKIKAIRLSLQAVNREIREENKLYKRTALALHYLLTYKHISAILEALKHLEVVTRLSPLCCENMAQSGAIAKIFVLIRSCNRSVPCMEVIRYAVQVLLNVAKYEKTTSAVYDVENCIDTLLELLQRYREKPGDKVADKGGSIFTKTCCLLAVLLKTTNRASDVRSRSKVVDCIYSLHKLTARKHKMNTTRILNKQRNSSMSISFIPETPVRTRIVSRLKPDWVLRRDKVEEITNPLQAIQMVMDTLGIPY
ncbi:Abnormal spindle-like microcephaly-associated protein, partial [Galemys pyrenaicus]